MRRKRPTDEELIDAQLAGKSEHELRRLLEKINRRQDLFAKMIKRMLGATRSYERERKKLDKEFSDVTDIQGDGHVDG